MSRSQLFKSLEAKLLGQSQRRRLGAIFKIQRDRAQGDAPRGPIFCRTIKTIAQDRKFPFGEFDTQLMRAPGLGPKSPSQVTLFIWAQTFGVREGLLAIRGFERAFFPPYQLGRPGLESKRLGRRTGGASLVFFFHPMLFEPTVEDSVGLGRFCEHDEAADFEVEAVHRIDRTLESLLERNAQAGPRVASTHSTRNGQGERRFVENAEFRGLKKGFHASAFTIACPSS